MASEQSKKNDGTAGGLIVPMLLVVAMGAGAGFGYGTFLGARPGGGVEKSAVEKAEQPTAGTDSKTPSPGEVVKKSDAGLLKESIVPLGPLVVNIGGSDGRWLRLEGFVTFAEPIKEGREPLVAQLTQDVMGYLRASTMGQLETASGLEFIRDDLSEIVQLRTNGRARRFLIGTFVIE